MPILCRKGVYMSDFLTLGIESSCDETSASVVRDGREILSNIISSQINTHKKYGGVVPEIASRMHLEAINAIIKEAIDEAGVKADAIDLLAVTKGPGLVGALLVGISAAKALSLALNKPMIGVNHMEGHICANYLAYQDLRPPFIGLVVSGGHTYLCEVKDFVEYEVIGRTRDDAAGESFDKVARSLGLGYPGGPEIEKAARKGKHTIDFPKSMMEKGNYEFSFSGLKTAVLNYLNTEKMAKREIIIEDLARSFQDTVVETLSFKTFNLLEEKNMNKLVLSGGVAANSALREKFEIEAKNRGINLYFPPLSLCTDNASMIASAGYYRYMNGARDDAYLKVYPNLEL